MPWAKLTPMQRKRLLIHAALVLIAGWLISTAWTALVPFFLGLLLAYLVLPIVDLLDRRAPRFLRRHRISRPLAIIIVYVVGVAALAGLVSSFIPAISAQFRALTEDVPAYWEQLQRLWLYDLTEFWDTIPPEVQATITTNLERAAGTVIDGVQRGVELTLKTVSQTISFVLGLVIIPFWLFYVLNDSRRASRAFFDLVPESAREDVRCVVTLVDDLLGAYFRGQLVVCLIVGIMVTIALFIVGIDLALLLGTFAGIFEIIPILGPWIGAIPAVLLAVLIRPSLGLWVALIFFVIQQFESIVLTPRISGHAVRFHPAVVMVIVVVGSQVAGLWGMLLGVPVAAVLRDVFRYLYLRTTERGTTPEMALENLRASIG